MGEDALPSVPRGVKTTCLWYDLGSKEEDLDESWSTGGPAGGCGRPEGPDRGRPRGTMRDEYDGARS